MILCYNKECKRGDIMDLYLKLKGALEAVERRYNELGEKLMDPELANDIKKMTELSRERAKLEKINDKYQILKEVVLGIAQAKEMLGLNDPEMTEMAKMELGELEPKILPLSEELQIMLLPSDPRDDKNVIVEIRGAAGGDEANIFAGDLYRMYTKWAEANEFKIELIGAQQSDAGGFSHIEFKVKGDGAYSLLKFESGAHRVQRVPKTETQGRVHTSTATVLVMPEAEEVDFELKMADLKIDTYRASGAGGQHVNTTDSAVRITHMPTGVVTQSQEGRSQHSNKEIALNMMRSKLYDALVKEQADARGDEAKSKIGTGDRSEKIRTYNYPQNRCTDHRIGFTLNRLDAIVEGQLQLVIDALLAEEQKEKLQNAGL